MKYFRTFQNKILLGVLLVVISGFSTYAQEAPPRPAKVEVRTARWLDFGAFTGGLSGGTVTVTHDGIRTATGSVQLLNFGANPSSALFDVTAIPGTVIQVNVTTPVMLTNSGSSMRLDINSFKPGRIFIHSGNRTTPTPLEIGGTLTIGAPGANPPGKYQGTVTITVINQ